VDENKFYINFNFVDRLISIGEVGSPTNYIDINPDEFRLLLDNMLEAESRISESVDGGVWALLQKGEA